MEKHYDEHYQGLKHQPIAIMQEDMTQEEFIGFLKGNIIKYICRMGHKDSEIKEAAKVKRYAGWLNDAIQGAEINLEE